jgi:translocator protein
VRDGEDLSAVVSSGHWRAMLTAGLAACLVAGLGAVITELGPWYYSLTEPSWKPPDWLFGPAWTVIFALAALSGYLCWSGEPRYSPNMARVLALFTVNGMLNIAWSLLFFRLHRLDWALVEVVLLWLSIAGLMVLTARSSRTASWLLLPYLAWVSFAGALNFAVLRLNGSTGLG